MYCKRDAYRFNVGVDVFADFSEVIQILFIGLLDIFIHLSPLMVFTVRCLVCVIRKSYLGMVATKRTFS